jgi:outer membrane receptor for ferric coprogen and ferric-rhodotorulic acid
MLRAPEPTPMRPIAASPTVRAESICLTPLRLALRAAFAGLLIGPAGVVLAQATSTPANVQMLRATTVVAPDDETSSTEHTRSYTSGKVTIGKGEQDVKDIPQSTTVITRQRLDDQNLRTLDQALEQATGITVQDDNNFQRSYFSRGFEIDSVQYDGIPLNNESGFLLQPDLAMYDRVEVLRGASGIFTGNGSPGGTINLVRKRAPADRQINATISGGSWNNYYGSVDATSKLNESGSLRGRVVASYTDREYFFDSAETKKYLLYGTLEYDIAPSTTVSVGVSHEDHDMRPYYSALPRFSNGVDLRLPRETYLNADWSRTKVQRDGIYGDITHRFNADWHAKVAVSHLREDNHDRSGAAFGTINPVNYTGSSISAFDAKLNGEQIGVDATLNGSFSAFGLKHDVLVGANYADREYDNYSSAWTVRNAAINPFTFNSANYATFPRTLSGTPTDRKTKQEQYGVYSSLRFSLTEQLKLIAGGRVSHYETENRNNLDGQVTARTKDAGIFTPYGALTFDLNPDWTAYASYAEIFTSQANRFDRTGAPLDPMTGDNYEIGIKGSLFEKRINTSFALFRVNQEGRAQADPFFPNPCAASPVGGACYTSDGKVRSQGFDTEFSGQLAPGWQVAAGYTFNTTKYLVDRNANGTPSANQGAPLSTFTPKHILRLWTTYQLPGELNAWNVGGGVNFQSETYKTSGALRFSQSAYAIWSARASYRINRNLTAALNINNIFDKTYYSTLGSTTLGNWYGAPRNVMATLNASF